jgi:hypothetical protein
MARGIFGCPVSSAPPNGPDAILDNHHTATAIWPLSIRQCDRGSPLKITLRASTVDGPRVIERVTARSRAVLRRCRTCSERVIMGRDPDR